MTALPAAVENVAVRDVFGAPSATKSSIEHGLQMLGMVPSLQGSKERTALLQAQSNYPSTPLHVYFIASGIVEAAVTGHELWSAESGDSSKFLSQWHRKVRWLALDQPVVTTITYTRTTAVKPLRSETQFIDWDAELKSIAPPAARRRSPAYSAFTELRAWLRLSVKEAAELVGVGRTTPTTSWQGKGHPPRPKQARRLYQLHAMVSAVVAQVGVDSAFKWFHAGTPSPFALLQKNDLAAVADAVERLTIRDIPRHSPLPGSDVSPPDGAVSAVPSGRRRSAIVEPRR